MCLAGARPLAATLQLVPLALALWALLWPSRLTATAAVPDPAWPDYYAKHTLRVLKSFGLENATEPAWMHLHSENPAATSVGLTLQCYKESLDDSCNSIPGNFRYTVQGLPVSGWLSWSNRKFTLQVTNQMLTHLNDGVMDISIEMSSSQRSDYKPWPAFLHLKRGKPLGPLRSIVAHDEPNHMGPYRSPGVLRIQVEERRMPFQNGFNGFPALASVTRWSTPPYSTSLYMEHLTPFTGLFEEQQMWWEDVPSQPGLFFVRGFQPMQGEDPRFLDAHAGFPAADGPRGIGWVSPYIQGLVDNAGRLVFAEISGRVGWLLPTGEVYTLAGWTLKAGRSPGWVRKPLDAIRTNQELRGTGAAFLAASGFGRPMDVAFDRSNPGTVYVSDLTKNCIWRLRIRGVSSFSDLTARPTSVDVDVLAGSPTAAAGYANGAGAVARFNQPFGLVFAHGALFVADSENHAVRRVNVSSGAVTTLWGGGPGFGGVLQARGADPQDQAACRAKAKVSVTSSQAASGVRPEIYWPAALRATSGGQLVLLEHGIGQIRRLDPVTHVSSVMANVNQKFGEYDHGWAWLDVDITGATGPVDGVWWCKAVGEEIEGDAGYHFNEVFAWVPPGGGGSKWVFKGRGGGADPYGWGSRDFLTPPHYAWLVAVDPRGAVLLAGLGGHGVTRVRLRQTGDPVVEDGDENWDYYRGMEWYHAGAIKGPSAVTLAYRHGNGAHNTLGLKSGDAWQTRGLSDDALLKFYGVPAATTADAERRRCIITYVKKQCGPTRDGLAAGAAADGAAPSVPGKPNATAITQGVVLRWALSTDNVAVAGYTLQVSSNAAFTAPVSGLSNVFVGNTDTLLLEGLGSLTYYARLRAADLAGNLSPWGGATSFRKSKRRRRPVGGSKGRRAAAEAAAAAAAAGGGGSPDQLEQAPVQADQAPVQADQAPGQPDQGPLGQQEQLAAAPGVAPARALVMAVGDSAPWSLGGAPGGLTAPEDASPTAAGAGGVPAGLGAAAGPSPTAAVDEGGALPVVVPSGDSDANSTAGGL